METPDLAGLTSMPTVVQVVIYAGAFAAALIAGLRAYISEARKKLPSAPGVTTDLAVPMLQIADMGPVRELAAQVERLADANERVADAHDKLLTLARHWIEDDRERYIRSLERLAEAARRG